MIDINKTLWENEYLNWRYNTLDIDEKYKACLTESKINENKEKIEIDIKLLIYWIEMLSTDGQNSKKLVSEEMIEIVKKKTGGKKHD